MKTTKVHIRGLTPLLMHSGQLIDPLNPHAIALSKLTGKRKKTEADHRAIAKTEFIGSLYVDEKGRPCLPGEVLEGCLVEGAKSFRLGKDAKRGIVVADNAVLIYDGPKDAEALWEAGGFVKRAAARVGQARVIRTRPMFSAWSCKFEIQWDPAVLDSERKLLEIVEASGQAGICDWRPKFGRFEIA